MKTKFIHVATISLVFLLTMITNAFADTNKSGMICNETWTLSGSPYIVTDNVLVVGGCTLTIELGVTVKFNVGRSMQIDGTLLAIGTNTNEITFTSNQPLPQAGDWGYILFSNSSVDATFDVNGNYLDGSVLEHAVVEYAGGVSIPNNGAVRLEDAHPYINYTTIQNNSSSGICAWNLSGNLTITNSKISNNTTSSDGGGIYAYGGAVTIAHNTISDNTASIGGGIVASGGAAIISSNTISNNTVLSTYGGGGIMSVGADTITNNIITYNNAPIGMGGGGLSIFGGAGTISNNIIKDNTASIGGGIFCNYYSSPSILGNIISGNTSSSSGGGIYSVGNVVTMSYNIISDNTAFLDSGGIGVGDSGVIGNAPISNNSIVRNTAQNAAAVKYSGPVFQDFIKNNTVTGNRTTGDSPTYIIFIGSNLPLNYNNIFANTATYELWNDNHQGSPIVNATNNWWGTLNPLDVIYDWFDDSTKGLVDYIPYESTLRTDVPLSPPRDLTVSENSGQLILTWSANEEADVAGYRVYWDADSDYPYANSVDVGKVTTYTLTGIDSIKKCGVAVTTYDADYNLTNDDTGTIVNENQTYGHESWFTRFRYIGDVNVDCTIDISDVILELRIALSLDLPKPCTDVSADGAWDISDVILTLRMSLGLDELKQCA